MKKRILIISSILILVIAAASLTGNENRPDADLVQAKHLEALLELHTRNLDTTAIFLPASRCKGCHGHDPLGNANVTLDGTDVNVFDDWETSMMGLSGVDPFWKAKVRQEVMSNPGHADELQSLCTSCHAPMGHFAALYKGQENYTLEDHQNDSLGLSGVGCLGCHSIGQNGLGNRFSGDIPFDTNRVAYGPFQNPLVGPMQLYINIKPTYSEHVSQGRFCSPCHTLITNTVDLEGNATGNSFVEQATFHEWLNSSYPAQGTTCQTCHMPQIEDPIKIANGYTSLQGRSPFNLHTFAGANSFMVDLIKRNKTALGVNASDANFDSTLAAITRNLRYNTLKAELSDPEFDNDSVSFELLLTNKSGHKFPSGYPSRRAFVEFKITRENGESIFTSGSFGSDGEIINYGGVVEPHHDIIRSENQVQIYEMNMGDVNGNFTTLLERGDRYLKDNRLPPLGFTNQHSTYDTVRIVGDAENDLDFNRAGPTQGTGKDIVHYKIGLNGYTGSIKVTAKVFYQTVPPEWLSEMRMVDAPEIASFLNMFDASENKPNLVAADSLDEVLNPLNIDALRVKSPVFYPNPTSAVSGINFQFANKPESMKLFSLTGQEMPVSWKKTASNLWHISLPNATGVFILQVESNGKKYNQRILINNP